MTCFKNRKLLVFFLVLIFFRPVFSQNDNSTPKALQVYQAIEQYYGANQIPLNGKLSSFVPSMCIHHPFFLSDNYHSGTITYMNVLYSNINIRYNIFDQTIEVLLTDQYNSTFGIIPPTDFITAFSINEKEFEKHTFNSTTQFYQVIYKGEISCLYLWNKKSSESEENGSYSMREYHHSKRKSYLLFTSELKPYKSKGSFAKHFPKAHKAKIYQYIKENNIDLKHSSDKSISELIDYCQTLTHE